MAVRKSFIFKHQTVQKKTRQGCSKNSKGMKKTRGQGGPRKRCKKLK